MIIECRDCKGKPKYKGYICRHCNGTKRRPARPDDFEAIMNEKDVEIATIQEALEAQSKALVEARGFVRKLAREKIVDADAMRNPFEQAYKASKKLAVALVDSWDGVAVADATPSEESESIE